jgi:Circadian oscillating protein COP23
MQSPVSNLSRMWLVLKIGLIFSFVFSPQQFVQAESSPSFNCYRKTSGEYITRLHMPSGKKYVVINWGRSDSINNKCSEASNKLQKFFKSGRLNYIVEAKTNGRLTIVCGLATESEQCNSKNKLFELLPGDTVSMFIKRIGGSTLSDERVDDDFIINFQKVFKYLLIQGE